MGQVGAEFIEDVVARAARPGSERTAALDHKVGDHPVEYEPFIKGDRFVRSA